MRFAFYVKQKDWLWAGFFNICILIIFLVDGFLKLKILCLCLGLFLVLFFVGFFLVLGIFCRNLKSVI